MRLLFLSLYFHPARHYGGPVASTWSLSRQLAEAGTQVRILTTDADGDERLPVDKGWQDLAPNLEVRYCRRIGRGLVAPAMLPAALRELAKADLVYLSGLFVWLLPFLAPAAKLLGKPLVVSPRGMALPEALASKRGKKRTFLRLAKMVGLNRAAFHVTSLPEADHLRTLFPKAEQKLIPNGVEIPSDEALAALRASPPNRPPYLLFLGRLHPHKQPELILEAFTTWAQAHPENQALHLRLVGPGEERLRHQLQTQAQAAGLESRIHIEPAVTGDAKAHLLIHATALLLASKSENFGMSVGEALAHQTPAIVTQSAPWQGLEKHRCGYWPETSTEALAESIQELVRLSEEERYEMGRRGRSWMEEEFGWEALAGRMLGWFETM